MQRSTSASRYQRTVWMECDTLYFRRRARQERQAAIRASHPGARDAHLQMADRFDELSEAIEASVQQWTTDSFDAAAPRSVNFEVEGRR
jgi:hypothetical protein